MGGSNSQETKEDHSDDHYKRNHHHRGSPTNQATGHYNVDRVMMLSPTSVTNRNPSAYEYGQGK